MKSKTRTSGYINTKRKYRNTTMDMAIIIFEIEYKLTYTRNSLIEKKLTYPALDFVLKCSHNFNLLDARGAHTHKESE